MFHTGVEERSFRFQSKLFSTYFADALLISSLAILRVRFVCIILEVKDKCRFSVLPLISSGAILISSILCSDRLSALRVCVML